MLCWRQVLNATYAKKLNPEISYKMLLPAPHANDHHIIITMIPMSPRNQTAMAPE
jgi:hypothetical protein